MKLIFKLLNEEAPHHFENDQQVINSYTVKANKLLEEEEFLDFMLLEHKTLEILHTHKEELESYIDQIAEEICFHVPLANETYIEFLYE